MEIIIFQQLQALDHVHMILILSIYDTLIIDENIKLIKYKDFKSREFKSY